MFPQDFTWVQHADAGGDFFITETYQTILLFATLFIYITISKLIFYNGLMHAQTTKWTDRLACQNIDLDRRNLFIFSETVYSHLVKHFLESVANETI